MSKKRKMEVEQHAAEKYNSRALMESYNEIAETHQEEFAGETFVGNIGVEVEAAEEQVSENEQTAAGGLMHTYAQMMDSYQEGTLDNKKKK